MKMNILTAFGLFVFVFAAGFIAGVVVVQGSLVKNVCGEPKSRNASDIGTSAQNDLQGTVESKYSVVTYNGIEKKWAESFAVIYDAVHEGYKEKLGMTLPDTTYIEITVTETKTRLFTDGIDRFFLKLEKPDDLLPTSPYKNIYGFAHEPGHISMYSGMSSVSGLPEGVGEGWAHYTGSVITDYIWEKLGENAYPVPYDFSHDGTRRIAKQAEGNPTDPSSLAAVLFYKLGVEYGHEKVGEAMKAALEGKPTGAELMPRFQDAVARTIGAEAAAMIPESLLVTVLKWNSKRIDQGKNPTADLFADQKIAEGFLHYGDGTNESMSSIAGSGHATIFHKAGGGKLTAVKLMGGRYGAPETDTMFRITILDASFKTLARAVFPYTEFPYGDTLEWREFRLDRIDVPETFFVCFDFSPTATNGVFAGLDDSSKGHSFTARPDDHIADFDDGEWMIQAKVD